MTRETNTVLFVLAGVLYNLVMMGLVFFVVIFILARVFAPIVTEQVGQILMVVALLASIGGSLYSYYRLVRLLQRKIDFDKYFVPLFKDGK
ncbi:hypothetical protein [Spirochaeta africana]|uniref:Leader peptide processing enzyme n=1 Tax=Spirochaeta africana (strain ATCC 700263 / DSM 8902 / Z-7692) TaxID=889378 RepID=H9UFP8_SPIAZ|nr:hypothetical protein [Spirochaeta africana]AFG36341.1 hypothetical protein Spiaf_0232 [Spirochaeta africana DSM 8902]